ncbi:hypothetical protein EVAR_38368_1 [Eumeta japonica]|uniref:Uncharacterized protein n=1 Tax=Eumeta variegata TaxID=151549 RepID=A0A4C1XXJ8_EUMVA|nr:hypothetical protein EVAR_38368_1 [Eumeta japonica]
MKAHGRRAIRHSQNGRGTIRGSVKTASFRFKSVGASRNPSADRVRRRRRHLRTGNGARLPKAAAALPSRRVANYAPPRA